MQVIEQIHETNLDEFQEFYSGLEERSSAKLAALASRLERPGIDISREVIYGQPAAEITRMAETNQVDLIALASHTVDPSQPGLGWAR